MGRRFIRGIYENGETGSWRRTISWQQEVYIACFRRRKRRVAAASDYPRD